MRRLYAVPALDPGWLDRARADVASADDATRLAWSLRYARSRYAPDPWVAWRTRRVAADDGD